MPGGAESLTASGAMALSGPVRAQFATALHRVFISGAVVSVLGLIATFFLPAVTFAKSTDAGAGEQMLEAEMTTLEPADEPVVVRDRAAQPNQPRRPRSAATMHEDHEVRRPFDRRAHRGPQMRRDGSRASQQDRRGDVRLPSRLHLSRFGGGERPS